ncbi:MAG: hypothetical protein ACOY90_12220 [Candidatus Zhuqueibacterota bacterium]
MEDRMSILSDNLKTQWQDHFHMRDQTWKVLQYSILFFLGVVGLEIKQVNIFYLALAYSAVILNSVFGLIIALHHRRRQKEKFEIIKAHEKELGIDTLIKSFLVTAHSTAVGKINTSTYIVVMQASLCMISVCLLIRLFMS